MVTTPVDGFAMEPPTVHRGISDNLVRLSVGVEDVADLQAELAQALG